MIAHREDAKKIMKLVDHAPLSPTASACDIRTQVLDANHFGAYSVCVEPFYAGLAKSLIEGEGYALKLAVVVDFPFGALTTERRLDQIRDLRATADEVDIVVQMGHIKSGRFDALLDDLRAISEEARANRILLKVIVETAYLTKEEKPGVFEVVVRSGVDFIKTSTGFASLRYAETEQSGVLGATVEDVILIRDIAAGLRSDIGIMASGGIRTKAQVLELIDASGGEADPMRIRIGTSGTKAIYEEMVRT